MLHFAHRGMIAYENTPQGVLEVFDNHQDLGVEIDVRFNTMRDVVMCHDRENRNDGKNPKFYELLEQLDHERYFGKKLMIDIKAFGMQSARDLAREIHSILVRFPTLYKNLSWYLCSFNEFCVDELLLLNTDKLCNIKIGVITTGLSLNMYAHFKDLSFVSIEYGMMCEEVMEELKKKHLDVYAWVVNDDSMKELMVKYEVNGIIYDIKNEKKNEK